MHSSSRRRRPLGVDADTNPSFGHSYNDRPALSARQLWRPRRPLRLPTGVEEALRQPRGGTVEDPEICVAPEQGPSVAEASSSRHQARESAQSARAETVISTEAAFAGTYDRLVFPDNVGSPTVDTSPVGEPHQPLHELRSKDGIDEDAAIEVAMSSTARSRQGLIGLDLGVSGQALNATLSGRHTLDDTNFSGRRLTALDGSPNSTFLRSLGNNGATPLTGSYGAKAHFIRVESSLNDTLGRSDRASMVLSDRQVAKEGSDTGTGGDMRGLRPFATLDTTNPSIVLRATLHGSNMDRPHAHVEGEGVAAGADERRRKRVTIAHRSLAPLRTREALELLRSPGRSGSKGGTIDDDDPPAMLGEEPLTMEAVERRFGPCDVLSSRPALRCLSYMSINSADSLLWCELPGTDEAIHRSYVAALHTPASVMAEHVRERERHRAEELGHPTELPPLWLMDGWSAEPPRGGGTTSILSSPLRLRDPKALRLAKLREALMRQSKVDMTGAEVVREAIQNSRRELRKYHRLRPRTERTANKVRQWCDRVHLIPTWTTDDTGETVLGVEHDPMEDHEADMNWAMQDEEMVRTRNLINRRRMEQSKEGRAVGPDGRPPGSRDGDEAVAARAKADMEVGPRGSLAAHRRLCAQLNPFETSPQPISTISGMIPSALPFLRHPSLVAGDGIPAPSTAENPLNLGVADESSVARASSTHAGRAELSSVERTLLDFLILTVLDGRSDWKAYFKESSHQSRRAEQPSMTASPSQAALSTPPKSRTRSAPALSELEVTRNGEEDESVEPSQFPDASSSPTPGWSDSVRPSDPSAATAEEGTSSASVEQVKSPRSMKAPPLLPTVFSSCLRNVFSLHKVNSVLLRQSEAELGLAVESPPVSSHMIPAAAAVAPLPSSSAPVAPPAALPLVLKVQVCVPRATDKSASARRQSVELQTVRRVVRVDGVELVQRLPIDVVRAIYDRCGGNRRGLHGGFDIPETCTRPWRSVLRRLIALVGPAQQPQANGGGEEGRQRWDPEQVELLSFVLDLDGGVMQSAWRATQMKRVIFHLHDQSMQKLQREHETLATVPKMAYVVEERRSSIASAQSETSRPFSASGTSALAEVSSPTGAVEAPRVLPADEEWHAILSHPPPGGEEDGSVVRTSPPKMEGVPYAPGDRCCYHLDMPNLYITTTLGMEELEQRIVPRLTALREAYHRAVMAAQMSSVDPGGAPRSPNRADNTTTMLATSLEHWVHQQALLNLETEYTMLLFSMHRHELSVAKFNQHVHSYNYHEARQRAVWGPLYRSALSLSYSLCRYLSTHGLEDLPESYIPLLHPVTLFVGCHGGHRELRAKLPEVMLDIVERAKRVRLPVDSISRTGKDAHALDQAAKAAAALGGDASSVISCLATEADVLSMPLRPFPPPKCRLAAVPPLSTHD